MIDYLVELESERNHLLLLVRNLIVRWLARSRGVVDANFTNNLMPAHQVDKPITKLGGAFVQITPQLNYLLLVPVV